MKIATWNVNSIKVRLDAVLKWLGENNADILCLQEIKCTDENFPLEAIEKAGYNVVFMGEKTYNGVAIISDREIKNAQYNMPDDPEDAPKRFIAADIDGIHIVNTYIPNGTTLWSDSFRFKLDWLQRLRNYFDQHYDRDQLVLLCGDFNVAMENLDVWNPERWEGKLHFSKPERAAMYHVKQWGFVDTFRMLNPYTREYSWWDFRTNAFDRNEGLRIDYVWASSALFDKCTKAWIDRAPREWERPSDHTPAIAEFSL